MGGKRGVQEEPDMVTLVPRILQDGSDARPVCALNQTARIVEKAFPNPFALIGSGTVQRVARNVEVHNPEAYFVLLIEHRDGESVATLPVVTQILRREASGCWLEPVPSKTVNELTVDRARTVPEDLNPVLHILRAEGQACMFIQMPSNGMRAGLSAVSCRALQAETVVRFGKKVQAVDPQRSGQPGVIVGKQAAQTEHGFSKARVSHESLCGGHG
jgi:hypothetical protein